MAGSVVQRASLFRETFAAIKATASEWWPWVLVFGIFFGALQLASAQIAANAPTTQFLRQHPEMVGDPQASKKYPELEKQYDALRKSSTPATVVAMVAYMLGVIAVHAIAFYTFAATYMRMTLPSGTVKPSVGGFIYWFLRILWKYLRPVLWFLLPIIGPFFYIRSIICRALVSPLALLQKGCELKTSWDMTEGNWWRLFWNQLGVSLCVVLIVVCLCVVPFLIIAVATHGVKTPAFHSVIGIFQGMTTSFGTMTSAIFSCVAYHILSQEKATTPPAP